MNPTHYEIVVCTNCRERVTRCRCANSHAAGATSTSKWSSAKTRSQRVRAYDEAMLTARASEILDELQRAGHRDAAAFLAVRNVDGRRIDLILRGTQPDRSNGRARPHVQRATLGALT